MVNNVTDRVPPLGGTGYSHAAGVPGPTRLKTTTQPTDRQSGTDGQDLPDKKIPMQVWQERAGKTLNAMTQRIRFTINPSDGKVIMETGEKPGASGIGPDFVTNPLMSHKGSIIKEIF